MNTEEPKYMILCENLVKIYKTEEIEVVALQGLDLKVEEGELMSIIGNSGSGKSTLLNMLGGLDRPSAGKLFINDQNLLKFSDKQLVQYRRETVGFVWQNNARNLIPYLTALENIEMPMTYKGKAKKEWARELLDMVGLSHRANNKLAQLSGGEQQRVAIAIALANRPKLILADEPTGAVDTKTAARILDVFRELNRTLGITIVIVTHDPQLSRKVDRVVAIRDGYTSSELLRKSSYADELEKLGEGIHVEEDSTHEEFAVMDRFGKIQIPLEYRESLNLKGQSKIKVELVDNQIIMMPMEKKVAE